MTLALDKDNPLTTKVQTRDGRKARLICVDRLTNAGPELVALITGKSGEEYLWGYNKSGSYWGDATEHANDLINVPVPPVEHRRWVNVIKWSDGSMTGHLFGTHTQADACANLWRIACVEVVFKEGDGL